MLNIAYLPRLYDNVVPEKESNSIHGYFLKNRHVFEDNGINLNLHGTPASNDLAWIGNGVWDNHKKEYSKLPLIQELVTDSSWLDRKSRLLLKDTQVIGMTRGGVLRDLAAYNEPGFDGSYHARLILESTPDAFDQSPQSVNIPLSKPELEKMIVSPSFAHILRHEKLYEWATNNRDIAIGGGNRRIKSHFVGAVEFVRQSVSTHRKLAYDIVAKCADSLSVGTETRKSDNRMNKSEYLKSLRESKVCVSPWGYGERCHRDYEAILSGCVLVKPDTSFLEMFPDLFDPARDLYVPCRVDFSDLPEIIDDINNNWSKYQDMRERALQFLLDGFDPGRAIGILADGLLERYETHTCNKEVVDVTRVS